MILLLLVGFHRETWVTYRRVVLVHIANIQNHGVQHLKSTIILFVSTVDIELRDLFAGSTVNP